MRKRDFRNVIIVILCFVVVGMSVGFAYLQSDVEVKGTANVTSASWDVEISSIQPCTAEMAAVDVECKSPVGNASNIEDGTKIDSIDKTKASFSSNLTAQGDEITYKVVVSNKGTLAAKVANISFDKTSTETQPVIFSYLNISKDDVIEPAANLDNPTNKVFYVTVGYDDTTDLEVVETSMTNNLLLTFVQAN